MSPTICPRSIASSMDIPDLIASTEDLELRFDVLEALRQKNQSAMRRVVVQVADGIVTLCGSVDSYYARQTLVHACAQFSGVGAVVDNLAVES